MAPHPDSLQAILGQTTRVPLYIHPELWTSSHLSALRVSGFDKTYLPQDAGRRDFALDILSRLINEVSQSESNTFPFVSFLAKARNLSADPTGANEIEVNAVLFCQFLLEAIYFDIRELNSPEGQSWKKYIRGRNLTLQFDNQHMTIMSDFCLYGYPNREVGSVGYPIVALLAKNIDHYELIRRRVHYKGESSMRRWIYKRRQASKEAEMVALLIAMAQKQYIALKAAKHKSPIDKEKPANFYPVLLVVSEATVQIVTAKVPRSYLKCLKDPYRPCYDGLEIRQTAPISLLKSKNISQLISTLSDAIDNFNSLYTEPRNFKELLKPTKFERLTKWSQRVFRFSVLSIARPCKFPKCLKLNAWFKRPTKWFQKIF